MDFYPNRLPMTQKDIYKVDNYFITFGVIFLIISAISIVADPRTYSEVSVRTGTSYTFEDKEGRSLEEIRKANNADEAFENGFPRIRTIVGINGLILLAIGLYYRAKEKKIISIWDALDRAGEARVKDLALSLGLTREFILKHLKNINAQRNVYYVYDSEQDKIADGKLMAEYVVVATCSGCGNSIDQRVSLNFSVLPKCKYCGTAISIEELNALKREVMSTRATLVSTEGKSDFSVGVFILLLVVFWPGAIAYVIIKKGKTIKSFTNQVEVQRQANA